MPTTPILKRKVVVYITWNNALLVFRHPDFPEAGIQAPAGTIEPDESPDDAALREAREETGLAGMAVVALLGEQVYDMTPFDRDERRHRYFFHLQCSETPPRTWRSLEEHPSDGGPPIAFDFFWASLPDDVPPLIVGHDTYLPVLAQRMGLTIS